MKKQDLSDITTADLQERLDTEEVNYVQLRINHAISPIENPSQIKPLRRQIARIKTELRKREINN